MGASWKLAIALAGGLLAATAASPAAAACSDNVKCGKGQTLSRIESKQCRPTRQRPAITIRRACCANTSGKVRCKPYRKCPRRSPSGSCE